LKAKRNLKLALSYKRQVLTLFFLSLFSASFGLIIPYISKLFIDKAFVDKNAHNFIKLSIVSAGLFLISTVMNLIASVVKNRISVRIKFDLASAFIKKIYMLDMAFFNSKAAGENIFRLSDTESVANFIVEFLPGTALDLVKVPIILGISLCVNVRMTIVLLILSPLFLVNRVFLQKKLRPISEEIWRTRAKLFRRITESFSKILIIKSFALERYQQRKYVKLLIENIRSLIKSFRWSTINTLSASFLSKCVLGVVTLYGGWMIIKGQLTLGSYTAVMIYLTQLGALLDSIGSRMTYWANGKVSMDRFYEIMDMVPRIKDQPDAIEPERIQGRINFKEVTFGYEKDKAIFENLNLEIPAGAWVGIVGSSGSGKTTLINLILRLYELDRGDIQLDGVSLKGIKLKSLRGHIGIATQQPLLFDLSVKENIRYGLKELSDAGIIEAAKIACIDTYITGLPQGYDSFIGEDACRLSQGQKQRIAIARAVARRPGILILDEATSSVDAYTEEKIRKNLRARRQGLGTIIISHRLSVVKDADKVYFFIKGRVIHGRHEELLRDSRDYRDFFHNQL
jgi:subfamily B ATP-binding cassette protein MsbA